MAEEYDIAAEAVAGVGTRTGIESAAVGAVRDAGSDLLLGLLLELVAEEESIEAVRPGSAPPSPDGSTPPRSPASPGTSA